MQTRPVNDPALRSSPLSRFRVATISAASSFSAASAASPGTEGRDYFGSNSAGRPLTIFTVSMLTRTT
jgi:hypothetical protein